IAGSFLFVDVAFFAANMVKFADGGWFPLALAALVFSLMTSWKLGRALLTEVTKSPLTMAEFVQSFAKSNTHRVPGVAVFMTSDPEGVPPVLLHHLKHNQVMHSKVVLMSIQTGDVPQVDPDDRIEYQDLGHGFHRVRATYCFIESPDVPDLLQRLPRFGLVLPPNVSYYLGR